MTLDRLGTPSALDKRSINSQKSAHFIDPSLQTFKRDRLNFTGRSSSNTRPRTRNTGGNWTAQYFNNRDLSGNSVSTEQFGDGSLNFYRNWGFGSPANTSADSFSARFSTERYLAPGLYKIRVQADDGIRVSVGGQKIIEQWTNQPFATSSGYFYSNGANQPISIDYFEGGGNAVLDFKVMPVTRFQDPINESQEWKTTVYSWNRGQGDRPPADFYWGDMGNPRAIGVVNLGSNTRADGKKGLAFDLGAGALKGDSERLPHDIFAFRSYTWADFDGSTYNFRARGDDGFQLLAKRHGTDDWLHITPKDQWVQAYGDVREFSYQLPAGRYDMTVHYYEERGSGNFDLSWEKAGNQNSSGVVILDPKQQDLNNQGGGASASFGQSLAFTLKWEGGYVNHPKDPGGATNKGILQTTYNSYRRNLGLPARSVRAITDREVNEIYYRNYWLRAGCDKLLSKLATAHFDATVNHGPGNSRRMLQQAQAAGGDEMNMVRRYLNLREQFFRSIVARKPDQQVFLRGWLRRVNDLRRALSV